MGCNWRDNLYSSWVVGPYGPNCSFWAFFVGGSSLPWYSWPRASFTLGLAAFANCPGPAQWMVRWLMGEINGQQLMILVVDYGWLVVEPTHLKSMLGSNWIILPGTLNVIHNLPRKRSLSLSLSLSSGLFAPTQRKRRKSTNKSCTRYAQEQVQLLQLQRFIHLLHSYKPPIVLVSFKCSPQHV